MTNSPVCICADVVYERAVFQSRLDLTERHILSGLQFHQVLLAV